MTLTSFIRLCIPFRYYSPIFGTLQRKSPSKPESDKDEIAIAIAKAISRAHRYLPFECRCLVQALTAKIMLKLRKRQSLVYIGVTKNRNHQLIAHAWVRCRGLYVCGAKEMHHHKVIAIYSD